MRMRFFDGLLSLVYPAKCLNCSKVLPHGEPLFVCGDCYGSFMIVNESERAAEGFAFLNRYSFFEYNEAVRAIIHDIKFGSKAHKMVGLSGFALKVAADKWAVEKDVDAIIAVPLHTNRLKERGFNQALVMAKVLSKSSGVPVVNDVCERIIDNPPQARVGREGRRKNSRGIFSLKNGANVQGLSFLICDDVFTSGETLNSLAMTLVDGGAKSVSCVTLAVSHGKNN